MKAARVAFLLVGQLALGLWLTAPGAAESSGPLTVSIEPATASVVLGDQLDLRVTVTNGAAQPTGPLVVHLDITDPRASASVDPEDWTATLSKSAGIVATNASATVDWTIQPIAGGSFAVYAVALSPGDDTLASSNVLNVTVADHRSLNPGGILPVAIGVPVLVGSLLVIQTRRVRRRPRSTRTRGVQPAKP